MFRIFLFVALLLACAAQAQTLERAVPGFYSMSGCPAVVLEPCWIPLGGTLTYTGPAQLIVGTQSTLVAAAGFYTRELHICTLPSSAANVWLRLDGAPATVGAGVAVLSAGRCVDLGSYSLPLPTAAINGITDGPAAQVVAVVGG